MREEEGGGTWREQEKEEEEGGYSGSSCKLRFFCIRRRFGKLVRNSSRLWSKNCYGLLWLLVRSFFLSSYG